MKLRSWQKLETTRMPDFLMGSKEKMREKAKSQRRQCEAGIIHLQSGRRNTELEGQQPVLSVRLEPILSPGPTGSLSLCNPKELP